ncbi:MAG: ABC transporter ATP-binding protein/permease [Methanomicrobiales archaeon]|nr:ABC transporter ATP-binding protein/permease [Methanomicrobiales archaeon]
MNLAPLRETLRDLFADLRTVTEPPEPIAVMASWRDLGFFTRCIRPMWPWVAAGLVLTLLLSGIRALLPLTSKIFFDYILLGLDPAEVGIFSAWYLQPLISLIEPAFSSVISLVILIIIAGGITAVLELAQSFLTMRFNQEVTYRLQTALFTHVLRFPVSYFKNTQVGYLESRLFGDVGALPGLISQLISLITTTFFLFFSLSIVLAISIPLTLIAVSVIPVLLLINWFFTTRLRSLTYTTMESSSHLSGDIQEVLSGIEVVKVHAAEDREMDRITDRLRRLIRLSIRGMVISSTAGYLSRAVRAIPTFLIMILGANEILAGRLTIGDYVAFTTYVAMMTGSLSALLFAPLNLQGILVPLGRMLELFHTLPEYGKGEAATGGSRPDRVRGEIAFRDVSFAYRKEEPVLSHINLTVKPGEAVAIAGPSGTGKTTLVNLVLRFYLPDTGSVLLDGTDTRTLDPRWLRSQISVVSQDIFLWNSSVEENIRYGRITATSGEVEQAARRAGIHDEILTLPKGYDTVIGERGATLSVGQRQRISIARAFLRDAPILILDEFTSALDAETERTVRASLRDLRKGKTTLVVSHHPQVLADADRVILLEKGRITADGPYRDLAGKGPILGPSPERGE